MPKITARFVQKSTFPPSGQVFFRDSELRGFALRVTPTCKSYIVESCLKGKSIRITIGKHGAWTTIMARRRAKQILGRIVLGEDPRRNHPRDKSTMTLGHVLDDYLKAKTLTKNTQRMYRQMLSRCIGDWLARPINSITKEDVRDRHKALSRGSGKGTSGKCQANMTMEMLRALINFASINYEKDDGKPIIEQNPVSTLTKNRLWHQIPRRKRILPDASLRRWYAAVTDLKQENVRDYLLLLLLTGLRKTEAATLKWSYIDFETRILTIPGSHTKNKQEHELPISSFTHQLLQKRYQQRRQSEYVFPGRGGHGHIVDSHHAVRTVGLRCGVQFSLHDLRRTFLTMAGKLEIPQYTLKRLANHISGTDVTDGYLILDIEDLRRPVERLTARFLELFGVNESRQ